MGCRVSLQPCRSGARVGVLLPQRHIFAEGVPVWQRVFPHRVDGERCGWRVQVPATLQDCPALNPDVDVLPL